MSDTKKPDDVSAEQTVKASQTTTPEQPVKRKPGRPKGAKDKVPGRPPNPNAWAGSAKSSRERPRIRHAHPIERIKIIEDIPPDPVQVVLDNMDDEGNVAPGSVTLDRKGQSHSTVAERREVMQTYSMHEIEPPKKKRNFTDRFHNEMGADRTSPGDNSKYIRYALMSLDLPPINITDPEQVRNRLIEYFTFCEEHDRKPSMIGMANWLGVGKDVLDDWKHGVFRSDTHTPIIRQALAAMEEIMVDYFQNGKVNPATGIFLLKNMFQYRDVQDVVVTPKNPIGDAAQQGQLEDKYLDVVEVPEDDNGGND